LVEVLGATGGLVSQTTPYTVAVDELLPPQHAAFWSQYSPVIRQPPAGAQTVTPVPMSLQMRVQQVEEPLQGSPPSTQPPDGWMQRPGWPFVASQSPEQHSFGE
jgi:hypothetical protein